MIAGLEPTAIVIGAGLALAFMVLVVGLPSAAEKRLRRRVGASALALTPGAQGDTAGPSMRINSQDSQVGAIDRLIKRYLASASGMRTRLAKTGRRILIGEYMLACLMTALVALVVNSAVLHLAFPMALAGALFAGAALPHLAVGHMIARRHKAFLAVFPEAIDLIVRGLKSGLPVTESIKNVGKEMPDPIGGEFRRIADELGFGQTLEEALATAAKRLDIAEFQFFVISLSVQRETGGNLSETLENLSLILRRRKQMRQKVKALSSEARASAMIIGSLPFLCFGAIFLLAPDYASMLLDDPRGNNIVAAAFTSMCMGAGIMMRMAKFEI
jgi:tight adherence protein B